MYSGIILFLLYKKHQLYLACKKKYPTLYLFVTNTYVNITYIIKYWTKQIRYEPIFWVESLKKPWISTTIINSSNGNSNIKEQYYKSINYPIVTTPALLCSYDPIKLIRIWKHITTDSIPCIYENKTKSSVSFLSVTALFYEKDKTDPIKEFDIYIKPEEYIVDNELLSCSYLMRYLEYNYSLHDRSIIKNTSDYKITVMDDNFDTFTLLPTQMVILCENKYKIVA